MSRAPLTLVDVAFHRGRSVFVAVLLAVGVMPTMNAQPDARPPPQLVRVGVLTDNYPYSFRGSDGRLQGFAYELLVEIEREMGLRFERVLGPTAEINAAFRDGRVEVLQSFAWSAEREATVEFSVPYLRMEGRIFSREGTPAIAALGDLKGRRVLVHAGSLGERLVRLAGLGDTIVPVESVREALIKIERGEGDATLAARLTGLALVHELKLKHLRVSDAPVAGYDVNYCIAVRKGENRLLARINEGMALLVRTGRFDEIYHKWFGFVAPAGFTSDQIFLVITAGLALALAVAAWAGLRQRALGRRISEQATLVRESEERYRQLLALAPVGIAVYSSGKIVFANQSAADMLGADSPDQIVGCSVVDVVHPDHREASRLRNEKMRAGEEVAYPVETAYLRFDGGTIDAEIRAAPIVYGGRPATQIVVADITARKQAEAETRLLTKRLTLATDAAAIGVWEWELGTDLVYATAICFTMLGDKPTKAGASRRHWFDPVHPDDQAKVRGKIEAVLHGDDSPYTYEARMRHADGTYRWVYSSGRVFERNPQGTATRVIGVRQDITARKEVEQALMAREEQLSAIYQNARDALFVVGVSPEGDFRFTSINRRFLDATGLKEADVLGVRVADALPAGGRAVTLAKYEMAIRSRQPVSWEETADYPSGRKFVVLTVVPVFDEAGRCTQLIGTAHDLTQRKRAEEEIRLASEQLRALAARLHAVREQERTAIAREIHDVLAQELTRLKIDLVWLAKRVARPIDEDVRAAIAARVNDAVGQTDTAISTVQRIATELRPVILDSLGLPAAIEWQTEDFGRRTGIACRACVPLDETALARDRATAIFRILQESLTNIARHAHATEVEVEFAEEEGGATLTVRDNGAGITRAQMDDPHSIGLLGMSERALAFGGTVKISGSPDGGTTVIVRLPIEAAVAAAPSS